MTYFCLARSVAIEILVPKEFTYNFGKELSKKQHSWEKINKNKQFNQLHLNNINDKHKYKIPNPNVP